MDNDKVKHTLPETNSSSLKIGLPKRKIIFQPSNLRCYVSFREGNLPQKESISPRPMERPEICVYATPVFIGATSKRDGSNLIQKMTKPDSEKSTHLSGFAIICTSLPITKKNKQDELSSFKPLS